MWMDDIRMNLREVGLRDMGLIDVVQEGDLREGSCEHGNEPSGSMNCWEVLEWLHKWQPLKKGSVPWI
jgi:hypothetical protein